VKRSPQTTRLLHRLLAPVPLLRFGQALASEPSISFVQRAYHNEVRTLLTAEGLKHSSESKDQVLWRYQHPFGVGVKWAVV
jgi:hypothetical protein